MPPLNPRWGAYAVTDIEWQAVARFFELLLQVDRRQSGRDLLQINLILDSLCNNKFVELALRKQVVTF